MKHGSRRRRLTILWTKITFFLNWKYGREQGVFGAPNKAYTYPVPDQHSEYPFGQTTFAFFTKCMTSAGGPLVMFVTPALHHGFCVITFATSTG